MTGAIVTEGLGKRYRRNWGLQDCTFAVPEGKVAALVGPNGAGKSTLMRMAAGLSRPTAGTVRILGRSPADQTVETLASVGYVDQERPLYRRLKVGDMLAVAKAWNSIWDDRLAHDYLDALGIPLDRKVGKLSLGQQAQVSITICLAKRPRVLLLDEPVAALDPVARHDLMGVLMGSVADQGTTVLLSSHVLSDLEAMCDYIVILCRSRVQVAADLEDALAAHRLLVGPAGRNPEAADQGGWVANVVHVTKSERQTHAVVRVDPARQPALPAGWEIIEPTLEEMVVAYLREGAGAAAEDTNRMVVDLDEAQSDAPAVTEDPPHR